MKTYKGTVKFPADGEPYDAGFGPQFNVAITMDDPNAPKAKDGIVRVYKKPGHEEAPYLKSLNSGDEVQMAFQTKGTQEWYSFVIPDEWGGQVDSDTGWEDAPKDVTYNVTNNVQSYPVNSQIYIPLTPDNLVVYTAVMGDNVDLLLHGLKIVGDKVEELGLELDAETRWKLAVTAHINTLNEFKRHLVLEADEPAF